MDAKDFFAYTVQLRGRILAALQAVSPDLLERDLGTNHHSILQTLIHIMAVEESWIREDIQGQRPLSWEEFRGRYLHDRELLDNVAAGWQRITAQTVAFLATEPDPGRSIIITAGGSQRSITIEQVIYHVATEELIHMGEILAMTRQLGIDLPGYFLLRVMAGNDRPWEQLIAQQK